MKNLRGKVKYINRLKFRVKSYVWVFLTVNQTVAAHRETFLLFPCGNPIRTNFLLDYISDVELRETITAATNKVEAYNGLCEWSSFGGMELVASNDDIEMEKAVKYNDIINNSYVNFQLFLI